MHELAIEKGQKIPVSSSSSSRSVESIGEVQGMKRAKIQQLGFNLKAEEGTPTTVWSLDNMSMKDMEWRKRQYYSLHPDKHPTMASILEPVSYKPSWYINFSLDNIFGSIVGETSYELYKHLHLPEDWMRLAHMYYIKIDEYLAYGQM